MTLNITLYRLHNQGLSQDKFKDPVDVVKHLGAVQAQDFAGAKWALGLRTNGLSDADVERAFADGSILRTHMLRPTWHFVTPEDIRWLIMLTGPRVHAGNAFMVRRLEIDRSTLKKSYRLLEKTLRDNNFLTRDEIGLIFRKAGVIAEGQRLAYIMMSAELDGLVCSGPRKGKQFTYALMDERVPAARTLTRQEALAELTKRYFTTRGPATLHDFTWWSGLTMADATAGMELVRSEFERQEIEGQTLWFPKSNSPRGGKHPTSYLLPNYDEYFIGFKDRSAIGKIAEREGIRKDDPALLANIIILDGQVVGGWRRTLKKDSVTVEARLITGLTRKEEQAVAQAAERFGQFLGLPVLFSMKDSANGQRNSRIF